MLKYRFFIFANVLIAMLVRHGICRVLYSVIQVIIVVVSIDGELTRVILRPVESDVWSVFVVGAGLLGVDRVELLSKLLEFVKIAYGDRSTSGL